MSIGLFWFAQPKQKKIKIILIPTWLKWPHTPWVQMFFSFVQKILPNFFYLIF